MKLARNTSTSENADDEEEAAAAVKLQAMQRGKKARQELAALGEAAATYPRRSSTAVPI